MVGGKKSNVGALQMTKFWSTESLCETFSLFMQTNTMTQAFFPID